jgi:hypothetical protein
MLLKEDKWSHMGHYAVEGVPEPVYSLRLAHEYKLKGKQVKFEFHTKLFQAAKPHIEPRWTLDELYSRRVRQLRKKYDYLVLLYSGGADSHNVLKYFQHTDTKLDEIVCYDDASYMGKEGKISREIFESAMPEVAQHLQQYPDTVHRRIELRDLQKKLFSDTSFNFDVYTDITYNMQPIGVKHAYGLTYVDHYKKLHDQGLKVGVIHGIDKPRIHVNTMNNKWSMHFFDWSAQYGHKHYYRDFPFYDEFFYHTPDDPWISIKMAHVTKNYMDYTDSINFNPTYRLDQRPNNIMRRSGNEINWEFCNHMIYPFWNPKTYSAGKNKESFIASSRDPSLAVYNDELLVDYKKQVEAAMVLGSQVAPMYQDLISGQKTNNLVGIVPFRTELLLLE